MEDIGYQLALNQQELKNIIKEYPPKEVSTIVMYHPLCPYYTPYTSTLMYHALCPYYTPYTSTLMYHALCPYYTPCTSTLMYHALCPY